MEKVLLTAFVVVLLAHSACSIQYVFQRPTYELQETYGEDNDDDTTVMISRTGTLEETSQQQIINLSTDCPPGITATATSSDDGKDFTVPDTVTFAANELEKVVAVTIETDTDHELREIFCLTIETDPGSEYTTTIVIPGNDFCYDIILPDQASYQLSLAKYIGPWLPDISNTVEISITPEGDDDVRIYLATHADRGESGLKWYGIFLEDADGTNHGGTNGDSLLVYVDNNNLMADDFERTLTNANTLIDSASAPNKLWLRYERSSGTISIGTDDDRDNPIGQHSASVAEDVKHIFASSTMAAHIEICHPGSPIKIDATDASSNGYQAGAVATRAIDGDRGRVFADGSCFLSDDIENPWLRIDLGREYDVKMILSWSIADDAAFNSGIDDDRLDNAEVWVGSCDENMNGVDLQDNIECSDDIGDGAKGVIELACPENTYGRYVYILVVSGQHSFSVCEVEVYGTEIPYGDETEVVFSQSKFDVNEDNMTVSISATRNGDVLTCTSADFYTDSRTLPVAGNTDDFTAISPLLPQTFHWDNADATGAIKTLSVTIDDDNVCEPYETFQAYLTNVFGGTLGSQSWTSVGINDDDSVTFSLESDSFSVSEDELSVDIGVLRSGTGTMQAGSAELIFTDGEATSDDYDNSPHPVSFDSSNVADSEDGAVEIIDDELYEGDETFTVMLGALTPPDTCSMPGQYSSATVTIEDNDSRFQWNSDASITIPEGEIRMVEITRDGDDQEKYLNVLIDDGTTESDDFSISPTSNGATTVRFPSGDSSETITITTESDSEVENDETFTLTLQDPLYPTGNRGDPYRLTVTISDNDGVYSWKQASYSVGESGEFVNVCLQRTEDISIEKTVDISSVGVTAVAGTDFMPLSSIMFGPGQAEACGEVRIFGDSAVEESKTFTLTILSGQDIALGEITVATVTIMDDDNIVGWSQPEYTFREDATGATVVISKSGVSSVSVTVTVTSGTATLNTDYQLDVSSGSSITIPTGSPGYSIPVTIFDDVEDEPTESFTLTLTSASLGVISEATTTVYISDDDLPSTPAPDTGLGAGAIAGIVGAVVVGVIIIIVVVVVFFYMTGAVGGGAAAAAQPIALPLSNYPPGYAGKGFGYGYGNAFNGYEGGLPNRGYNPYLYNGPYRF